MWFEYRQNNSGGSFDCDDKICHLVLIEAGNEEAAESKAMALGVYFDGCDREIDCSCCGDRWYRAGSAEKGTTAEILGRLVAERHRFFWTTPEIRAYFADGRVAEIAFRVMRACENDEPLPAIDKLKAQCEKENKNGYP